MTSESRENNRSSVQLSSSLLTDSAFCELETDSITEKNVTCLDHFRLIHIADEGSIRCDYCIENLSNISVYCDENCPSTISIDSQSLAESGDLCADGCAESSSIEELETSDTESQGRGTEGDSLSRITELSSPVSLSDNSITLLVPDEPHENEQVTNVKTLSDSHQCANVVVASSSNASVGKESQLLHHQPLVFFIIGLFVGLSLGFFTCKYAAEAE